MASVPELDFAALTAPIPGDNPAGTRVPFTLRQRMEAARKDFEPNPDDPSASPVPKKPDWNLILKLGIETLTETSKDLEVAMRMTEALAKQGKLAGLRDGFKLLTALVENSWDNLHPIPDPADGEGPEIRAERFNWIGDLDAGARFPHTVRDIPFLRVGNRAISMRDRQMAFDGQNDLTADEVGMAQLESDTTLAEIEAACEAFYELDKTLTAKLENHAPGMMGLRQVLDEIQTLARKLGGTTGGAESNGDANGQPGGEASADSGGGGSGDGNIRNREDAYRAIERIADTLARMEPHSPIPDLLRRAVELGRMPFSRLIKQLIRDPGALAEVFREFGIKDDQS